MRLGVPSWNGWSWRGSQFLIAPKCIFVPKTSPKRAFCNHPCALWLARFLAADATSDFQTIVDVHAFSSETFSPPNFVQHACHSRAYLQLRDTSAEHKWRFGGTKGPARTCARTCRNVPRRLEECGTLAKRLTVGLTFGRRVAFAWPEFDTHASAARSDAHL